MNKEKILEKARKDNDEMEQVVLTTSLGISTIVIPIMCLIFIILKMINSKYVISDLVSITLAQLSISQLYYAFKMRKTILFIFGITTSILMVIFTIIFINEVMI